MSRQLRLPGSRDLPASLDEPPDGASTAASGSDANGRGACAVACPPHPQMGGTRSDRRLQAVSEALVGRGVACLRFDYGPWDEGEGERADARTAVGWAADRYDRVGLFGYSFGAAVALLAATGRTDLAAVSALAPPASLGPDLDAVAALGGIECPVQVLHGERDDTVDSQPVVERATELGCAVVALPTDHRLVGHLDETAGTVAVFLARELDDRSEREQFE